MMRYKYSKLKVYSSDGDSDYFDIVEVYLKETH